MDYRLYTKTIELFASKKEKGGYTMTPVKKWVDRDENCQPIISYKDQRNENVGLVLDELIIIDLDIHKKSENGIKTFNNWIRKQDNIDEILDDMKNTMTVLTPSGGMHIYFKIPKDTENTEKPKVKAMPGVDLLTGKNKYIPAPVCNRIDGIYKIKEDSDTDIKDAPQWAIKLFKDAQSDNVKTSNFKPISSKFGSIRDLSNEQIHHPMNQILNDLFNGFGEGERNMKMASHIGRLMNQVKREVITLQMARYVAIATAENCNPPMSYEELETIWTSILKKSMKEPF